MSYLVHVKPSGYTFTVNENETVLDAALRQDFIFPYNCRSMICGTCKGQLLEGQVSYDEDLLFALSDEEREQGFALFCSAKPQTDLVIQIDGVIGPAYIPVKKLNYKVYKIELLSSNIYRILLRPADEESLQYRAGQYLEILHKDMSPHAFSIANAPLDSHWIELHMRNLPDNPFYQYLFAELNQDFPLRLAGPYGNMYYRREPAYPIILLAGGTGFAPCKAIIEQALAEGLQRPMYLYWGARNFKELYLHDMVLRWTKYVPHFHYVPVLSAPLPEDNWQGRTGLVHEAVLADFKTFDQYHIYASGPLEMVVAAQKAFLQQGLNKAFMYSDWFEKESTLL